MGHSIYSVRRATIDDLAALLELWASMRFPVAELERRLTEFQVVVTPDGALLGAVGLQIIERAGRLHSEAFNDFALADILRDLLWERILSVAANHGLSRIWTSESAPFWRRNGLQSADAVLLKKLPPAWSTPLADWLTVQLRDEEALQQSIEVQFKRLRDQERQLTEETLRKARILNFVAIVLVIFVVIGGIFICVYLLRNNPNLLRR